MNIPFKKVEIVLSSQPESNSRTTTNTNNNAERDHALLAEFIGNNNYEDKHYTSDKPLRVKYKNQEYKITLTEDLVKIPKTHGEGSNLFIFPKQTNIKMKGATASFLPCPGYFTLNPKNSKKVVFKKNTNKSGFSWGFKLLNTNVTKKKAKRELERNRNTGNKSHLKNKVITIINKKRGNQFALLMWRHQQDLHKLITSKKLNSLDICNWTLKLLIEYKEVFMDGEGKEIVHGDIKPENIFISKNELYFGDFGSSIRLGTKEKIKTLTPGYCDPRLTDSNEIDDLRYTDLYSLGVVIRILIGYYPDAVRFIKNHTFYAPHYNNIHQFVKRDKETISMLKKCGVLELLRKASCCLTDKDPKKRNIDNAIQYAHQAIQQHNKKKKSFIKKLTSLIDEYEKHLQQSTSDEKSQLEENSQLSNTSETSSSIQLANKTPIDNKLNCIDTLKSKVKELSNTRDDISAIAKEIKSLAQEYRITLAQHRDEQGTVFMKSLANILTLGIFSALYHSTEPYCFWPTQGEVTMDKIENYCNKKIITCRVEN